MGPRAGLEGRNISSPPGFDPRIVPPVASRYNDELFGPQSSTLHTAICIGHTEISQMGKITSVYTCTL